MNNTRHRSILCPNCKKLISNDEVKCPYCGLTDPGNPLKALFFKGFGQPEVFIKTIVSINVGLYVLSLLLSTRLMGPMHGPFSLLAPDSRVLSLLGATGSHVVSASQGWWTLVSANYLHAGIIHIVFNMMVFWQICPLVIREYGIARTLVIYTLSGVAGFGLSVAAGVYLTVGASAAICGLMGALIFYGKSRGGVYGRIIFKQIGGWVLGLFIFGFLMQSVNNWAHAGGLLCGIVLGFVLGYEERGREKKQHRQLAGFLALLTVAVLVWAVLLGIFYRFF